MPTYILKQFEALRRDFLQLPDCLYMDVREGTWEGKPKMTTYRIAGGSRQEREEFEALAERAGVLTLEWARQSGGSAHGTAGLEPRRFWYDILVRLNPDELEAFSPGRETDAKGAIIETVLLHRLGNVASVAARTLFRLNTSSLRWDLSELGGAPGKGAPGEAETLEGWLSIPQIARIAKLTKNQARTLGRRLDGFKTDEGVCLKQKERHVREAQYSWNCNRPEVQALVKKAQASGKR